MSNSKDSSDSPPTPSEQEHLDQADPAVLSDETAKADETAKQDEAVKPAPPPKPAPAAEAAPPPPPAPPEATPAPQAPKPDPLLDERSTGSETYLRSPITLEEFRTLVGVPNEQPLGSKLPRWWGRGRGTHDVERNLGIYQTIQREERRTMQRHDLYNALVYTSLIVQLIVSALLIMLAALPQEHHITLAVLGGANGVIAGVLGLIRGQGYPGRLLQYADGLRKVRETAEWLEKELQTNKRPVSYREVVRLREMYQTIRGDEHSNHPDSWMSGMAAHAGPPAGQSTAPGATH